jgi:hypothetical protein
MKTFKYLIFCLFSIGCKHQSNESSDIQTKEKPETQIADSISLDKNCFQKDTTTLLGTKIKYIYQQGLFRIVCSDSSFSRKTGSLYACHYDSISGLCDLVPKLESETTNNLLFTYVYFTSSGRNCAPLEYSAIIIPKNNTDAIIEKYFFIMQKGDYLFYGDGTIPNVIHLMNIETKQIQDFELDPLPALSRSPTMSIREIKITGKLFYVKYEAFLENTEPQIVIKKLKIKI